MNLGVSEDLTEKVTASANYLGSVFSSAWTKTAKTAGDATANSSSFLSSALTKVTGPAANKEEEDKKDDAPAAAAENRESKKEEATEGQSAAMTASSLFSSAIGSFGFGGAAAPAAKEEEEKVHSLTIFLF